jgi:hypothetical protein
MTLRQKLIKATLNVEMRIIDQSLISFRSKEDLAEILSRPVLKSGEGDRDMIFRMVGAICFSLASGLASRFLGTLLRDLF